MKIFEESFIKNLLKCNQCNECFNDYDQPKSLPCGKIVCNICESKIETEAICGRFKCAICSKDHLIPDEGLNINELAYQLVMSKAQEIWRGQKFETLENNLRNLKSMSRELKDNLDNGVDYIKEHCNEQRRRSQLSTEKKMKELNDLNEETMKRIAEYEEKCIQTYKVKDESLKVKINQIINEVNEFTNAKQEYLNKLQIDAGEINLYIEMAEEMQFKLKQELNNCKSLTFDNKIIKFNPDTNQSVIGEIDYEHITPTVIIKLLIILILPADREPFLKTGFKLQFDYC